MTTRKRKQNMRSTSLRNLNNQRASQVRLEDWTGNFIVVANVKHVQ